MFSVLPWTAIKNLLIHYSKRNGVSELVGCKQLESMPNWRILKKKTLNEIICTPNVYFGNEKFYQGKLRKIKAKENYWKKSGSYSVTRKKLFSL